VTVTTQRKYASLQHWNKEGTSKFSSNKKEHSKTSHSLSPPPLSMNIKVGGNQKARGLGGGEGVRTNLARIVGDHNKNFKEENLKNWGKKGQEQWWHTVLIPPPCSALLGSHLYGGDLQLRRFITTLISLYI
jgi:hypothetical protein